MKERGRVSTVPLNSSSNSSSNSAITQPVGQPRNVRRTQQIKALHSEFEDLKKKIKDVQSKNQKIIENIHKQYDFKKKPQTIEYMVQPQAILYYQNQLETRKSHEYAENHSNPSDNSQYQYKMKHPQLNRNSSSSQKQVRPAFHRSIEFKRPDQEPEQKDNFNPSTSKVSSSHSMRPPLPNQQNSQFGLSFGSQSGIKEIQSQQQFPTSQVSAINPFKVPMPIPAYPQNITNMSLNHVGSVYGQGFPPSNYQFQQTLRRERQKIKILEKQLQERQADSVNLKKLQKKYSLLSTSYGQMVEGMLQQFMQEIVKKKIYQIDKYVRKNDNKLKRLHLKIKDKEEEYRSNRIIQEHRSKRSNSRSKRETSPRQTYYNSLTSVPKIPMRKAAPLCQPPNIESASKSKGSDVIKSNQQFSVIANGYEQMIKVKNKDYQQLQQKFKQKDKELTEATNKCIKIQSMLEEYHSTRNSKDINSQQKEENLLLNTELEQQKQAEIKNLLLKIEEIQQQLHNKQKQIRDKDASSDKINKKITELELKNKKNQAQLIKLRETLKKTDALVKSDNELQNSLKKLQSQLQLKDKECQVLRQKCSKIESEKIQKQCQNLNFNNKIKKIQNLLKVKEDKIQQLENIIQSNTGTEAAEFLQKSMYLEKFDPSQIHQMQEDKQKLEQQLSRQREEIFALKKNNESLSNKYSELKVSNQNLKRDHQTLLIQSESMKINIKAMQFDKYGPIQSKSPLQKLLDQRDCVSEEEEHQIKEQLQDLKLKLQESQRALKHQKQQSLQFNTKLIKMNSEINYYQQLLCQREAKYQKLRKQFQQNRVQSNQLQAALEQKQKELQVQRKINSEKIKQIESQWLQFEQMRNKQQNNIGQSQAQSDLMASRLSEQSYINYKNTFNSVSAQNEQLLQKLKEQEKMIEVHREMENKIVQEYRQNIDKIKTELRDKSKQNEQLTEEVQSLKRKNRIMQQTASTIQQSPKTQNQQEQLLGAPNQRMMQLQLQLAEVKQINSKLTAMQQELFKQVSDKEEQYQNLMRIIHQKNLKIQQLQQILELKQINLSSHITNSQHRSKVRESIQSQSSLRYSMLSNNNLPLKDKTMEMEFSEAGQSFFEVNQSMMSNVSEVFNRQQFPYQKMHLRRVQQRRLFQKTAAYIKSLKSAIDQKNKRIKLLQKKIDSLRNSQLVRKDIYDIKQCFQSNHEEVFKDYLSMQQVDNNSQRYRYKQLEHQTKLTIEENNFLNNQIQSLQNDLQKAEDQQNSLMKLKDLYKDEIKALNKKIQDLTKAYEDDIKKEKQKVQQSQSYQKMQAIKQLYLKIMEVIIAIETEGPKSNKREQRRRLLQDYVKVFCNLLDLQSSVRDKLLLDLIK